MSTNVTNNICINRYPYEEQYPQTINEPTISKETNCKLKMDKGSVTSNDHITQNKAEDVDSVTLNKTDTKSHKTPVDIAKSAVEDTSKMKDLIHKKGKYTEEKGKKKIENYLASANNLISDIKDSEEKEILQNAIKYNSTDCSGFIKMISRESGRPLLSILKNGEENLKNSYKTGTDGYRKRYRGAELLRRGTNEVKKEDVKTGDLIFFKDIDGSKTTDYATHVGIISKVKKDINGKTTIHFIHKSTNGGVIESTLNSKARMNQNVTYNDLNPTFGRIK